MQGGVTLCYVNYYVTFLFALGVNFLPLHASKSMLSGCWEDGAGRMEQGETQQGGGGGGDSGKTPHRRAT